MTTETEPIRERLGPRILETDETGRLERIVGDLLDLARLEGGGGSLVIGEVLVAQLFERVQARHERAAADAGASVPRSASATTAAGAARDPAPKNASSDVSYPSTLPSRTAAKMLSGAVSATRPRWRTESVAVSGLHAGTPSPRAVAFA